MALRLRPRRISRASCCRERVSGYLEISIDSSLSVGLERRHRRRSLEDDIYRGDEYHDIDTGEQVVLLSGKPQKRDDSGQE